MKSLFLILSLVLFAGSAFCQEVKSTPAVMVIPAGTVVATAVPTPESVTSDGLKLVVDQDYTWQTTVVDPKLEFGSPEFAAARLLCLAYDHAVANAKEDALEENWSKAEDESPESVVKAFYGLNHLRYLMGGTLDNGVWGGYAVDKKGKYSGPNKDSIKAQFDKVENWVFLANQHKKFADGKGNQLKVVEDYLDKYAQGILSEVVK